MKLQFRQTQKISILLSLALALSCTAMPLQAEAALQAEQETEAPNDALLHTEEETPAENQEISSESKQEPSTNVADGKTASEQPAEEPSPQQPEGEPSPQQQQEGTSPQQQEGTSPQQPEGEPSPDQPAEETPPENGLVQQGNSYVLYVGGVQVTAAGWQELSTGKFLVGSSGYVTARMEEIGGTWKFYQYNSSTAAWDLQINVWETVTGKDYYFNASGNCTEIYDTVSSQLTVSINGRMRPACNCIYPLRDGRIYYFDSSGIRSTASEWKKPASTEWYYVNADGYVSKKLTKTKQTWKYYNYNYTSSQWEKQKDLWKTIEGKKYYFNSSGKCTKIFSPDTKKCKKYHNGKMAAVKKEICRLHNGKLYYFNSKGIQITKQGWKKNTSSQYVQIAKKGYVTCKMEKKDGYWRFYKYDYSGGKWQKQKKVWRTVNNKKYYFNGSGKCIRLYHNISQKCYDFKDGRQILVTNAIRSIRGTKYYFGPDGVKMNSPGLYLTAASQLIYVSANGRVERIIPGEILSYTTADGKITSCRIRDSHFMYYYNGDGTIRRQIDLNRPMVALTYDDGPSIYTSAILDLLGQYGSTATFFVLGQRAASYPDILRRACSMSCEIGNHTYSHKILTNAGIPEIQNQINSTNMAVQSITGISPAVMRPPGGGYNSTVAGAVGMPMIMWSIDTLDWKTRNAGRTQATVLNHVSDGDIILMHDLYQQTAEASSVIIPELVSRGYQLVTISELSDCRGGMAAGVAYQSFR